MRRLLAIMVACGAAQAAASTLFSRQRRRYAGSRRHVLVSQGGARLRLAGDEIEDAVVSVMMGGVVLDLRQSRLPAPPARLDVLVVMGGLQLVVPAEWSVRIDVEQSMAGVDDSRTGGLDPDRPPDLVLSGRLVMGGISISSEMP
jgi:hypothetical protein